jgi:hypothetical protein
MGGRGMMGRFHIHCDFTRYHPSLKASLRKSNDLLVSHERAYLEHCRKYALDNP